MKLIWVLSLIPVLVVCDRLAHLWIEPTINNWLGRTGLFYFGRIPSDYLRIFDLTIGLILIAVSEELVFRKFALNWLKRSGFGVLGCILISASIFALMHWGSGLNRVAATFVFGVASMGLYIRHTRLWPVVVAHYITNFIAFADF